MTKNQLTREENVQAVFDLKAGYTLGLADVEILKRVARMALAAMDSEPVAWTWQHLKQWHVTNDEERARDLAWDGVKIEPLYRHAQPSLVPDKMTYQDGVLFVLNNDMSSIERGTVAMRAWNACRAAMLQAGNSPVIPDTWISVSERLPEEGGRYWCYVEEQNSLGKSHYQWNCSWNGEIWGGAMMYGRVTHWMPLPAAPQEVKGE